MAQNIEFLFAPPAISEGIRLPAGTLPGLTYFGGFFGGVGYF
ncbi:hypothetical protein [Telluribacter sp.]|jgi:hypothetical protein|nr:hypothetical protein [Telluribacter sp.]